MPLFGWIRDLFGIQKDMYETKKTRLEIEKIEDEKREKLITPATLDDVKKYDSKVKRLLESIRDDMGKNGIGGINLFERLPLWFFGVYIVVGFVGSILLLVLILYYASL